MKKTLCFLFMLLMLLPAWMGFAQEETHFTWLRRQS